jgi:Tol biopolymer transport system component
VHFNPSTLKVELTLLDARGEIQKTAWSSDKDFGFQGWVNDHQVVILQGSEFIVVDVLQNSPIRFSPLDFPDFDPSYSYFSGDFDPFMTRAFYKSGNINLFDLGTKRIITHIDDSYDRPPIVEWQPSGERAAVVGTISAAQKTYDSPDEIFVVEKDGQTRQLTHLYDNFGVVHPIHSIRWSPDGEKIAFWLYAEKGNVTLMVIDVGTGAVTNYCVSNVTTTNFSTDFSAPLWSPDGKYLLVENRYSADSSRLLVIDLLNKVAFPITENANPVGWMVSP